MNDFWEKRDSTTARFLASQGAAFDEDVEEAPSEYFEEVFSGDDLYCLECEGVLIIEEGKRVVCSKCKQVY